MDKKSQLQILCEERIPRLLRGESASEVFEGENKNMRLCDQTCPDYYSAKGFPNNNLCEQDSEMVFLPYCRLGYPPIAQSSPKCTDEDQKSSQRSSIYPHPKLFS